ncbi:MAG: hypothetical protein J0I06_28180 [Planctomycetes bacterium]|nr:hypothetical protein [Planctomycetota bacterium]
MNLRIAILLAGCTAAGALAGCSGGGPDPATVSGAVKVNGAPVANGTIAFAPADGTGAPATGDIKNGRYEVRTTAGKKVVQVSVPVVSGKHKAHVGPDAPWVEVTSESLPDKYHSKSELTFEVKAGSNTKDWDLTVKK